MINYLRIDTEGTCLVCESIFSPVNTDQGSDGQTHTHSTQTSSSAAILGNPIGQGVLTRAGVGQGNVCGHWAWERLACHASAKDRAAQTVHPFRQIRENGEGGTYHALLMHQPSIHPSPPSRPTRNAMVESDGGPGSCRPLHPLLGFGPSPYPAVALH